MADAGAVILSAIEKLDSWLLQKPDLQDGDHDKLCSLRLEKKDLLVGMLEFWVNDNGMLYWLLVEVASLWHVVLKKVDNDKLYSFLGEMEDIWELNCREKLHSLLVQMLVQNVQKEKVFRLAVEMADVWKDGKGNLNKEKLYTWLANKTDLWEEEKLFRLLERMTLYLQRVIKRMENQRKNHKNVERVRNDLRSILNKLEDEGNSHGHLHYFMYDVVEMAHDVQLLLLLQDSDPFILFHQFFRSSKVHGIHLWKGELNFREEMKLIHRRLEETEKRVRKFGEINNVREEILVGTSPTYSESDHHVVGLKEDAERLIRSGNDIISIRGVAGIGKTTLAREIYNHPEIVDEFECRAWVCLSSWKFSRKELLIKLIRQFIESKRDDVLSEKMENKALRHMLHQYLQNKSYIIVLDDVSEEIYLQYVYRMLPDDKKRILLFTTRIDIIRCASDDRVHHMKNLDGDKSWQLLCAFFGTGDHEGFPKQLEKKGRDILMRKCDGLPIAIKDVGRHWAEKRRSGSEWKELVVEESLMNLELTETLVLVESTYLNMDPYMKRSFLCLAFFKEGTIVRKEKVMPIWAAVRESADECGFHLLEIQSIIEGVDGTGKKFRINVHFHRLSITKAVDEIGFEILRKDGSNRASHEPCHHRVIHCSRDDKFNYNYSSTNQDKDLVSLFFYGGGGLLDICWKHFEQLRILDMEGFGLKVLPETVGDLTELRYLGLRNNYVQELPQSLRCLKMIEVLDIAQNFIMEVPDFLWEMDRLHHLYMSNIICRKLLIALKNLETLTYISVDNWTYEVSGLKMMTRLYKLGIEKVDGNSNVSKLFASLAELEKLDYLILRGFRFRSMPSLDELGLLQKLTKLKLVGRLTRLPSATNFPPELRKLVLINSCLDEDPMPTLEMLPRLSSLDLQNAYTGHEMIISSDGFRLLNVLVIREFWNLKNIVKVGGAMLYLRRIEIHSCPYLKSVP